MADKIRIDNNAFIYPMPMVVVGALVGERANYMAAAWVNRVNAEPPLMAVAIGKGHLTGRGIHEHGEFSINVPATELIEKVDYVGMVSGQRTDKSTVFEAFFGSLRHAPLVQHCPLAMACRLRQVVDLPSNELFIGEVAEAWCEKECLTDGDPDIRKLRPFVLSMPDNRYWGVGDYAGAAWNIGSSLRTS
jgi:flavin reductase (DIM6/NTAB) family NADH-FMN oxidoreductase RutF